jgi:hypothetical protein
MSEVNQVNNMNTTQPGPSIASRKSVASELEDSMEATLPILVVGTKVDLSSQTIRKRRYSIVEELKGDEVQLCTLAKSNFTIGSSTFERIEAFFNRVIDYKFYHHLMQPPLPRSHLLTQTTTTTTTTANVSSNVPPPVMAKHFETTIDMDPIVNDRPPLHRRTTSPTSHQRPGSPPFRRPQMFQERPGSPPFRHKPFYT